VSDTAPNTEPQGEATQGAEPTLGTEAAPPPEVGSAPERAAAGARPTGGALWQWFWQPSRARSLREGTARTSARAKELSARARASREAAEQLVMLRDAEGDLAAGPVVAELLRQSVHWAALALSEIEGLRPSCPSELSAELWLEVAGRAGVQDADALWEKWLALSYAALWEEPVARVRLDQFFRLSQDLVERLEAPWNLLDKLWFQRLFRLGVPLLAAGALLGVLAYSSHRQAVAAETAYPWRASSLLGGSEGGCASPKQECAEVRYFFHTHDESSPWIEFDLGSELAVQRVRVANRNDCPECPKRAVPLILEVSRDQKDWTQVSRTTDSFDDWNVDAKGTRARWVRLRSSKKTFLHFRQVRIQADK
jgi:hypothetical protein